MNSPAYKVIGMIAWLITAIAAINWGLEAAGYDLFDLPFVQMNLANLIVPIKYVIGVLGGISLLMFFHSMVIGHHKF